MSAILASPLSSHADLRSESRSYNRDNNQVQRWRLGPRPDMRSTIAPQVGGSWSAGNDGESQWTDSKTRPMKPLSKYSPGSRDNRNISTKDRTKSKQKQVGRVARVIHAHEEITSGIPLAAGTDKLKGHKGYSHARNPSISSSNPDILYSFDAVTSPLPGPRSLTDLGGYVEQAYHKLEKNREKGTIKIVRSEYDIVDGHEVDDIKLDGEEYELV